MNLEQLVVDGAMVGVIVAGTKVLTTMLDPKKRLERWYPIIPIVLAIPLAGLRYARAGWLEVIVMTLVYGFAAGHAYKTGKTTVLGQ